MGTVTMAGSSTIEWTEMTWNPVTGCTKVSQGCKNCYAERMAKRLQGMGVPQYRRGFKPTLAPHVVDDPYRWRKPRVVFVNSMSDLFHETVPVEYIRRVFRVMRETPHAYQVLTKRADRLAEVSGALEWSENIWMGVSVEDARVTDRIDRLRECDAVHRFLSLEPLIGPLDNLNLDGIDWVIVGGESGPRARPIMKSWIESIQRQCEAATVPFFFKQWGKPAFNDDPTDPTIAKEHPSHAKGGCQLDGAIYRDLPVAPPAVTGAQKAAL
jgi:protein gp37